MKITRLFCCIIYLLAAYTTHIPLQAQEEAAAPLAPAPTATPAQPPAAPSTEAAAGAEKPAAPAGPEVKAEQLKWPDTIELSEAQKDLAQTSNKGTLTSFHTSKKTIQEADELLNKITKAYEEFSKKFEDINLKIDNFIQETAFSKGKSQEQITPSLKK